MYSIIVGIIMFVSVILILIILVQNSKGGGLSSQFGGGSSNQYMGVQKTNNLLEKITWTFAITIVFLTLLTNVYIESPDTNIENASPNINRANEQTNLPPSIPNEIKGLNDSEIDSLI